jgi:hypothetical protein
MDDLQKLLIVKARTVKLEVTGMTSLDAIAVCALVALDIMNDGLAPGKPRVLQDFHDTALKFLEGYGSFNRLLCDIHRHPS